LKLLLDTNVVSEPASRAPNPRVLAWIAAQDPLALHVSVVTWAEIEEGIARLPRSRRRRELEDWREALFESIEDRLLIVDRRIASAWGAIRARLALRKLSMAPIDGFIAATAEVYGMIVVSRNARHFAPWGGPLINPWSED